MKKSILFSLLIALCSITYAAAPTYHNMFVAYYSPKNVAAMTDYIKQQGLGGVLLWEVKGDLPYSSSASLLNALNQGLVGDADSLLRMGYWSDWSVYPGGHAIPDKKPYGITGSKDSGGNTVTNTDLDNKLAGLNTLAYSFLEAQSKNYTYYDQQQKRTVTKVNPNFANDGGTLFFYDPWSDLFPPKSSHFCNTTDKSSMAYKVCWYVGDMQGHTPAQSGKMGNFVAFSQLPIKNKVISIGGYAHDATYEDTFSAEKYMNNFVNSAKAIVDAYHLQGVDLDYEDPNMTHAQSKKYFQLVKKLRAALGADKLITVTMLSDPDYIKGERAPHGSGFAQGVLKNLAGLNVRFNLMTYDFHGAFDYDSTNANNSRTGFLTNLYKPDTALPSDYDPKFSVDAAVKAMLDQGIPAAQISVGIPAYGRTLQGVDSNNGGLFQPISAGAQSIPRGNLDDKNCNQSIPLSGNACSGSFEYRYIVDHMLGNGFNVNERTTRAGISNGVTAYASAWSVPANKSYQLTVKNNGSGLGFNVSIHNANASFISDWLNPGASKTYNASSNPSTLSISGEKGLTVGWQDYKGKGVCRAKLDLTTNKTIMVNVDASGQGRCVFK
jgi:GH18 family chitinase